MYDCLKNDYEIRQEDLILYGQSVGSGPTLHLGSRLQKLRAVVLHSAILSGIRVLYPVKLTFWFDIFKVSSSLNLLFCYRAQFIELVLKIPLQYFQNIDKIRHVNCTVLVIHVSSYSLHLFCLSTILLEFNVFVLWFYCFLLPPHLFLNFCLMKNIKES